MKTVIFDLDGTLANLDHRLHHIKNGNSNWDEFHAQCVNDEIIIPICELYKMVRDSYSFRMVIVSGRSDIVYKETEDWLTKHEIWFDDLIMRKHGDYRPDDLIKGEVLDKLLSKGHEILFVVDDRQRVVDMWRKRGLVCLQAAAWEDEDYLDSSLDLTFTGFPSIARLSRDIVITEKLDGTNAQIRIYREVSGKLKMLVGSRTRWITPGDDNAGFAKWAKANEEDLIVGLGEGSHFGEWWGKGIQCGYGLKEKRFSLFNTHRWGDEATRPPCCDVVPVLYKGEFSMEKIEEALLELQQHGSKASPGFMQPEGIVIYHAHSNTMFKKTLKNDDKGKSYGS